MKPARHSSVWPRLQAGQAPQAGSQQTSTRSPARQAGDAVADFDDLARALVAGDEGRGLRQHAAHRGEVGVAQPGGPDPDPDLAGAEAHRLDVVEDFELVLAYLVQYGCAHGAAPLRYVVGPGGSGVFDDGVGEDRRVVPFDGGHRDPDAAVRPPHPDAQGLAGEDDPGEARGVRADAGDVAAEQRCRRRP